MKKFAFQLLMLTQIFNFGILHAQEFQNSNINGVWSAADLSGFRLGQDICHRYSLSLADNNLGNLLINIYFIAEDDRYSIGYRGIVPFSYTILEMDTIANKPTAMEISYEAARFTFQEMPGYDPNTIPPDHLSYVEEIKQHITDRKEEYRINLEENAGLLIEGFSLHNANDHIYFQKGSPLGSCDTMRRN